MFDLRPIEVIIYGACSPSPPALPEEIRLIYGHHLHLLKLKQQCVVTAPGLMNQTLLTTWRVTDTR